MIRQTGGKSALHCKNKVIGAYSLYDRDFAKADTVKFTLYGKAKLDVAKIPEFIASYGNNLKFTMDAKAPYFTYFLKKNSREKNVDARAVIEDFLNGVRENLKIAQDSVKKE